MRYEIQTAQTEDMVLQKQSQPCHFGDLDSLPLGDILALLRKAAEFRAQFGENGFVEPTLNHKCIVGAFFENSTRTRMSFELAAKHLGAEFVNFQTATSSTAKGESLRNTLRTIQALGASAIAVRHSAAGFPYFAARVLDIPVVNAGDGSHAHPTQTLADLLTIQDAFGKLDGLKIACIGDFLHSRVAHSFVGTLLRFGSSVTVASPATMRANRKYCAELAEPFSQIQWTNDVNEAIEEADVVMALRIQSERHQSGRVEPGMAAYARKFALKPAHLKLLAPRAIVQHAGPINEGIDLSVAVARAENSKIEAQVQNGLFVRMAVLQYVCQGGEL